MHTPDDAARLSRQLGDTVVRLWGRLPQGIQRELFEHAVLGQGDETVREQLARFLHERNERTAHRPAVALPARDMTSHNL